MAVAIDEIVYIGVILDVFLREEHKVFATLTHIGRLLVVGSFQAGVLGPVQSEPHTPAGMYVGKCPLTQFRMEQVAQQLELLVWITETVAVCQEEDFSVNLGGERLLVQDDTALFLSVFVGPDVVVAREVMHLDTHVGQFREFAEETGIALRYHVFVFVPEVEHVAQQVDGSGLLLDRVKKSHQPAFLHPSMWDGL